MLLILTAALLQSCPDIRPQDEAAWGASIQDVQRVLDAAASELWCHFPDRTLEPILVEPKGGPIALHARGPDGEYRVRLATGGTLWAQYTFQFAHELGHILCGYDADPHRQKWFEESLCELASLFVLRRSAETWKTSPPYAHWTSYAPALADYAQERLKGLPEGTSLEAWYRENAAALEKDATDRARNNVVAAALLPLFEEDPSRWEAVTWLNTEKLDETHTFAQVLGAWKRNAPEKHRAFIEEVARRFGIE